MPGSLDLSSMTLQRPTVEEGLAAEEAMLEMMCQGELSLAGLAWSPRDHALVIPRRHRHLAGFTDAQSILAKRGWPILLRPTRATGATLVPQSEAVVNMALVIRCRVNNSTALLEWGYHRLGDPWCDWLESLGVTSADLGPVAGAYYDGRFNVRIDRRKLVGTAQRWRRVRGSSDMALLIHGTMQVDDAPHSLAEVINEFQAAVDDPLRYQNASHIALTQAVPRLDLETSISDLMHRLLTTQQAWSAEAERVA